MKGDNNKVLGILITWPFLLCLIVLLVNDWFLKDIFHNFITGKLSDFSGIAVIALLLFSSIPKQKLWSYLFIASAFLWWKSPLSDGFIQFINSHSSMNIGRVIDYSDLWALIILPVCHYVVINLQKFEIASLVSRKIISLPLAVITLFAIMGTAQFSTHQSYVIQPISETIKLERRVLFDAISTVAAEHKLTCEDCLADSESGTFKSEDDTVITDQGVTIAGQGVTMSYTFLENNAVSFNINAMSSGFLYFRTSGQEKADALRKSLKSLIAEKFEGLEYVEPLKSKY